MDQYIKKQQITLFILVILVCVISTAVYIDIRTIENMRTQMFSAKKTIAELTNTDASQHANSARVADLEKSSNNIAAKILTKELIPNFLSHLEDIAVFNGVTIDVSGVEAVLRDNISMLSVSFSVKGSQHGVQDFLDAIQHQPQAIRFAQLNMTLSTPVPEEVKKGVVVHLGQTNATASGILEVLSFKQ